MKQTEIGLIPEDWEVKSLGDSVDILRGGSPRPIENYLTTNADGINWIKIGDVKPNDKYIRKTEEKIIPEGKSRSREVKKGDFILSNSMSFGRPYILAIDGCIHDGWLTIQKYAETFDKEFLYYLLGSDEVFNQYVQMAAGSSVQNLNKDKVADLQLKIPPLPEQQRIAKALSDVDALISTTEKLIQKKKNIKQGTMQNLITGKKRLPGFGPQTKSPAYKQTELGLIPEDWEVMSLGEFCQIKDGTHGTYARVENGYLLLSAKNILNGKLDIQESESLISENAYKEIVKNGFPKKKDLLISCVGTIGRCCIFDTDEEIAFQRSVAFIRQNQIDNLFLMYFIQSDLFQKQLREAVNASTLGGVYLEAFNPLQISFSSDKKEQTAIANVLSSMDKEIETLNTKLEKYRNLKTAMMQQLLTGKIRL